MIADVQKHLRNAKLSIADIEDNIAEFSAVKADTASDPDNQATEDAEAASIRAAKVTSAKAELSQAIAHLHGALTADWSADVLPVGDAPATGTTDHGAADAQPSPNTYGGGGAYGSGTWGSLPITPITPIAPAEAPAATPMAPNENTPPIEVAPATAPAPAVITAETTATAPAVETPAAAPTISEPAAPVAEPTVQPAAEAQPETAVPIVEPTAPAAESAPTPAAEPAAQPAETPVQ